MASGADSHDRERRSRLSGKALDELRSESAVGGIIGTYQWPEWWSWDLELSSHVLKRMEDRDFNEVDPRRMLEHARGYRADIVDDRFVIDARHAGRQWEIILEPDAERQLLVVITAYPVEKP